MPFFSKKKSREQTRIFTSLHLCGLKILGQVILRGGLELHRLNLCFESTDTWALRIPERVNTKRTPYPRVEVVRIQRVAWFEFCLLDRMWLLESRENIRTLELWVYHRVEKSSVKWVKLARERSKELAPSNILCMLVTWLVSKSSGWLKELAR